MSKSHKGLPADSQAWADEVDALMAENKQLREAVKRLCANAGIDYSNPSRGINTGDTPSVRNPVNQKLSSLADTDIYNVADKQVLTWNQKDQKWLPATPAAAGGGSAPVPITMAYTGGGTMVGYGHFDVPAKKWAYTSTSPEGNFEAWATKTAYLGSGDWDTGTGYSVVNVTPGDIFGRPYITLEAVDYADNTSAYATLSSYQFRLNGATLEAWAMTTPNRPTPVPNTREGAMVYDATLKKPIWWNGTAWRDALGNAV